MQEENKAQPMIVRLIRVLFTAKLSKRTTILTYLIILIVLTATGIIAGTILLTLPTNRSIRLNNYGSSGSCQPANLSCTVTFSVLSDLPAPINVYYQLQNFIANSKDYLNSRSRKQLYGRPITISEASRCSPYVTNREMEVTKSWGGFELRPDDVASPCGLQAKLYFRDTFQLRNSMGRVIPLRTTKLLSLFVRQPESEVSQWVDPTSDSFEVWMTTSVNPVLQKIYGVIEQPLPKGTYTLEIQNKMNYGSDVQKNVLFLYEKNDMGDSKMIGYMLLVGSLTLMLLIMLYGFRITGQYGKQPKN